MIKGFHKYVSLVVAMSLALHAFIPHHHHDNVVEKIRCHAAIHTQCDVSGDLSLDNNCDDLHLDHKLDVEHSIIKKVINTDLDWIYDFAEFSTTSDAMVMIISDRKESLHDDDISLYGRLLWPSISHRGPPSVA